jgi:hypothetical protein
LRVTVNEHGAFLRRAVSHLAYLGVQQFLDLGRSVASEVETAGIARRVQRGSRFVRVEVDPAEAARHEVSVAGDLGVTAVHGDPGDPVSVLASPGIRSVLNLSRPIAVLMVSVLDAPSATTPARTLVARLGGCLPVGSYLVISHATAEPAAPDGTDPDRPPGDPLDLADQRPICRTKAEIIALLDGFDPLAPGIVRLPAWRPDFDSRRPKGIADFPYYGAVLLRRP